MLGDWPITEQRIDTEVHSDIAEDIHELEQQVTESHSPVRKLNQFVVAAGLEEGVRTYIVPPPLICQLNPPIYIASPTNVRIR